jgi:DnaK suppressor protein
LAIADPAQDRYRATRLGDIRSGTLAEKFMSNDIESLDQKFIQKQRLQLTRLRDALRSTAAGAESEETAVKGALNSESREYEDDAQNMDALEKEGLLVNRSVERLARVERALEKIDAGTYGFSEVSGKPIPTERLEAIPEAVNTTAEQEASEKGK